MSKFVRSLFLISISVFSFATFGDLQVTSQKEPAEQDNYISDSTQEKKKKDSGNKKFFDALADSKGVVPASEKIEAIKRLYEADPIRAIPILIRYLDFEDEAVHKRFPREGQIDIDEQNDVSQSMLFPAIGSLMHYGRVALPALVEVIENDPPDSTRSKNARRTVEIIFMREEGEDNVLKGVIYLEKAASESKAVNGSENLLLAARQLMELNEWLQRPPQ